MKKLLFKNFPHLLHGADYNPEQWKEYSSVLEDDMRLMKKAGMNEMTVGIFAWAELEPEEGQFDFSFFDGVLDRALSNISMLVLGSNFFISSLITKSFFRISFLMNLPETFLG